MRATATQIETQGTVPAGPAPPMQRRADRPVPAPGRHGRTERRAPVALALLTAVAVLAAGTGTAPGPALAEPPSLSVVNASSTPVAQVHVSPDYATTWGNNRLAGTLPPGARQDIAVDDRPDHCYYDVQITDAAGKQRAYWNQNLCTRPSFEYSGD